MGFTRGCLSQHLLSTAGVHQAELRLRLGAKVPHISYLVTGFPGASSTAVNNCLSHGLD